MIPFSAKVLCYQSLQSALKVGAKVLNFPEPKLFTGPGSSLDLCDHIAATGATKVLVVTDEFLHKLGLLTPILDRLDSHGVQVTVYDAVTPDPTVEQVENGLAALKKNGCTAVLAVGGGSSIDAAKIIAARARNPHKVVHMGGLLRVVIPPLPLYAVPTTAGTGSEVTIAAVISDPATSRKFVVMDPKLVPKAAALDAGLMTGLPTSVTIASGMDALTHAVEAYLSRNHTGMTDEQALTATSTITENLPVVFRDGANLDARQAMAVGSYQAGVAFTTAGVGWVHAISHQFGAQYHRPHGWLNAIILPRILDFYRPVHETRLADLARATGLDDGTRSDSQLADAFIGHVRSMNSLFDVPDQLDVLRAEDIPLITERAMHEANWTYAVPRYMDRPECEAFVRQMLPA